MAATVQQTINEKGVFHAVLAVATAATPGTVYVGHLRDVTVQVVRTGTTDTLAVTGSNDGTNFAAVQSIRQEATSAGTGGGNQALSAVTNMLETILQKCEYLRFTPSGNTDSFAIIVSGQTRN